MKIINETYNRFMQQTHISTTTLDRCFYTDKDIIEGLSGKQARGTHFCVILPSLFIVNTLDSMWWIHKVPITVDKTEVRCGFAFPKKTINRKDFDDISKIYYRRWDKVIEEDNGIVEEQYKGIRSQKYAKNGRFVDVESVVFDFNKWVVSRIIGDEEVNKNTSIQKEELSC